MANLEFIYRRHSVRSYLKEDVPLDHIREILTAAIHAPRGKVENWHFIVVKNQEKIEGLAGIIEKKNREIAERLPDQEMRDSFIGHVKNATHFRKAPVVILVYAGPYPVTGLKEIRAAGYSQDEVEALIGTSPAIQNISAAMENLMLAAVELGYGTCWLTGPNYAAREITEYIGFNKEGYKFAAMTPLGVPAGEVKSPPRKDVANYMTVID